MALAEQKKREINKFVKEQRNQEKLNAARENLSMVRGEAASLKDLMKENPTLAFKNITEYVQNLDKTLCEPQGTFIDCDVRFSVTKTMIEVGERRTPMVEKQCLNPEKVRIFNM